MPTSDFPLTPTSVPCVPRALSSTSEICSPAGEGCSRGGQLLRPSSLYICRRKKEKQNYLCAGFRDKRVRGEPWADFHMKSAEGGWACLKRQVLGPSERRQDPEHRALPAGHASTSPVPLCWRIPCRLCWWSCFSFCFTIILDMKLVKEIVEPILICNSALILLS